MEDKNNVILMIIRCFYFNLTRRKLMSISQKGSGLLIQSFNLVSVSNSSRRLMDLSQTSTLDWTFDLNSQLIIS